MGKKKKELSIQKSILNILEQTPTQSFTYKQVGSRLGINDPSGRNHIIKSLKKLNELKLIEQVKRGSYQVAQKKEIF